MAPRRRPAQPSNTDPSDLALAVEDTVQVGARGRRPTRRCVELNAPSDLESVPLAAEPAGPIPDPGPQAPLPRAKAARRNPRPLNPLVNQDLEYFDIEAYSDPSDDDEPGEAPIPRARAPRRRAADPGTVIMGTRTTTVDPLESVQSTERAPDVHYFFEKRKNEASTCTPCRSVGSIRPPR